MRMTFTEIDQVNEVNCEIEIKYKIKTKKWKLIYEMKYHVLKNIIIHLGSTKMNYKQTNTNIKDSSDAEPE